MPAGREDSGVGIKVSVATPRASRVIGPTKIECGLLTHSLTGLERSRNPSAFGVGWNWMAAGEPLWKPKPRPVPKASEPDPESSRDGSASQAADRNGDIAAGIGALLSREAGIMSH